MGYAGKWVERERARELRAESWTLLDIARELDVSKGSVSLWVRDVEFVPRPRNRGHAAHKPHPLTIKKQAEIDRCRLDAERWLGSMSDRELAFFCLALYAGEGAKADKSVKFANTDPRLMRVFVAWFRKEFQIDETRLRMVVYLHEDLDIVAATAFWSEAVGIPESQFTKPYRAVADATRRANRHSNGCASVTYNCRSTHRRVMAMIEAVTSAFAIPG
jgi:hypothetical protein